MRCYLIWGTCLAFGSALLIGCGSTRARLPDTRGVTRPTLSQTNLLDDPDMERVARAHAHYGAGIIHDINKESEEAQKDYYQAALDDLGNESLILEVSRRLLQSKESEKALDLVSRAAARTDASGPIFARLGLIHAQLGHFDQAVAANRTAIQKSPKSLDGYQNLFLIYLQKKQELDALGILDEAAKQSDADPEFLISLAELYTSFTLQVPSQRENVKPKALALLNSVQKQLPATPPLRLMLAEQYNTLGETDKAAQLYLEVIKQLPDAAAIRERVHAKLTDIYLRTQDHKRASEQLQAIIRDDPTNPVAYYYLGSLALEDKKAAEAADFFSKTILLKPDFEQAYYDLANAQISLKRTSDALATLQEARKKFSQNFVLEVLTGTAFGQQRAYKEAVQHYTAAEVVAQATEPKRLNQFFYFQLGAACERNGDLGQAEKYFEKCLQLAPDFVEAMNYLGYMWAEHDQNLDKARGLIEKALKAQPKNAAYLDSMGWVLFKLKQPKEALECILKALESLEEPDATVYDHLGDIYSALGQVDQAREAWRKSLSVEPNNEVRKKLGAEVTQ